MAYNRRNLLKRLIEIQDITLKHTVQGISQAWVFRNLIRDKYHISRPTFDSYMSINAKKDLRDMDDKNEAEASNQLKLF